MFRDVDHLLDVYYRERERRGNCHTVIQGAIRSTPEQYAASLLVWTAACKAMGCLTASETEVLECLVWRAWSVRRTAEHIQRSYVFVKWEEVRARARLRETLNRMKESGNEDHKTNSVF